MTPASHALPDASRSHAAETMGGPQQDKSSTAESSAERAGRLPPRPLPLSVSTRDGVSQSDVTQLRDAVEEDEPEDARRLRLSERPQLHSAGSAGVAIVVGAHQQRGSLRLLLRSFEQFIHIRFVFIERSRDKRGTGNVSISC